MIIPALHRQVVPMDSQAHRKLRVKPMADWGIAAELNSVFIAASEMIDACREYPIVFVNAGNDAAGAPQIAPVAVFGLSAKENLLLDGARWRADYVPAVLRLYPFVIGRLDAENFAVCIDTSWQGLSESEGQPLFDDKGEMSDLSKRAVEQLQQSEPRQLVTRVVGQPEQADQVLHVRCLEKAEPAVFHVRDPAPRQLQFQQCAVAGGTHQHRLVA